MRTIGWLTWVVSAWIAGASGALGASLSLLEPLSGYTGSEARALSPDGRYVVGHVAGGTGSDPATKGVLWDALTATPVGSGWLVSSDGAGSLNCTGVGYRLVAPGVRQLVAVGMTASGINLYASNDGGVTWGLKHRHLNTTGNYPNQAYGAANTLGSGGADDTCYFGWSYATGNQLMMDRASGGTAPAYEPELVLSIKGLPSGTTGSVQGVSGTGVAVGIRGGQNYRLTWATGTPAASFFNGLNGTTTGEAWAISNDGSRIFGRSPVPGGRAGTWPYVWDGTHPPAELPTYPDTTGSASNAVPYGASADGSYAVGMNYRGQERAVLWDLRSPDPAGWTVADLTEYFSAAGVLGDFIRLTRCYSVGVDELGRVWVAGVGVAAGGTRGFVGMISGSTGEPIGACCTDGFGTRTCAIAFESQCGGTFSPNMICEDACPPCGVPFADADYDSDVDQADFGYLQSCYTGGQSPMLPACACFDRNKDQRIDESDVSAFIDCATGAQLPWSQEMRPDCVAGDGRLP